MILSTLTRHRRQVFQILLACGDAGAICAAYWVAILARTRLDQAMGLNPLVQQAPAAPRLLALSLIFVAVHAAMGLYEIRRGWKAGQLAVSVPVASGTAAALFLAYSYVVQDYSISRFAMLLMWALGAVASWLLRFVARRMVQWCGSRGVGTKRVVVVGENAVASAICRQIGASPHLGLTLAGQAMPREAAPGARTKLARGSVEEIAAELVRARPHRVIFTLDISRHEELQRLAEYCLARNIEVLQVPAMYHRYPGQVKIGELLGIPVLGLGRQGLEGWELVVKNFSERAIAAVLISLLSPLLAAVALGIWWSTGGPVLHRARRAGRAGVPFTLVEFEPCGAGGRRLAPAWAGSLMFRLRLQRLPRLFNVLAGDMSLVGPSPDTPEGLRHLSEWQRSRLSVKPGLTGLAQVRGHHGNGGLAAMIQDDLSYIESQSLMLDAGIFMRTIGRLFTPAPGRVRATASERHPSPLPVPRAEPEESHP